jgi:hypothetical protein
MTTTTTDKLQVEIRMGGQRDLNFVLSSWTSAIKAVYPNQYALDFSHHYHQYLSHLLAKSTIVVMCLADDPNEIISYLVYTAFRHNQIIHYAYTKLDARRQGYVKQLMEFSNPLNYPVVFTHPAKRPKTMEQLSKRYIYDPTVLQLL